MSLLSHHNDLTVISILFKIVIIPHCMHIYIHTYTYTQMDTYIDEWQSTCTFHFLDSKNSTTSDILLLLLLLLIVT